MFKRGVCIVVLVLLATGCARDQGSKPVTSSGSRTMGDATAEFYASREGRVFLVLWHDLLSVNRAAGGFGGDFFGRSGDEIEIEGDYETDGRRLEWSCRSSDGVAGIVVVDGTEYDLAAGGLFVVDAEADGMTVTQIDCDLGSSEFPDAMLRRLVATQPAVRAIVGEEVRARIEAREFVQVGTMHEAIGMGEDQGRVALSDITARPRFFGVGALAGLRGEITVLGSEPIVTMVNDDGAPVSADAATAQATMLVGESVSGWAKTELPADVAPRKFDETVEAAAIRQGIDVSIPFVFVVQGEFRDVRLHVINGACPIHAAREGLAIEARNRPFTLDRADVSGTLVGVYATDKTGLLTHPGASTHTHLIYVDEDSGRRVTGHVEQIGLAQGAVVKVPAR